MPYTNKRQGKLTLLRKKKKGGAGVGAVWVALCDCGKTKEVLARKVMSGAISSCGTCSSGASPRPALQGLPKGHLKSYLNLLKTAKELDITVQEYVRASTGRCIACNTNKVRVEWGEPGGPYNSTNLIAICTDCSTYRHGRSIRKLLGWLVQVHKYMQRLVMQEFR